MEPKIFIQAKDVAKIVRAVLKASFPATVFSVTTEHHRTIRVGWIDGPATKAVQDRVGKYEGADFDGMIDLKSYHESDLDGQRVQFGNDFLFCNRDYSEQAWHEAISWYVQKFGQPQGMIEFIPAEPHCSGYLKCSDYRDQEIIWRHMSETTIN